MPAPHQRVHLLPLGRCQAESSPLVIPGFTTFVRKEGHIVKRLLCLSFFLIAPLIAQPSKYPFNDPNLPPGERIANLLALMTVDEKINCLGTRTAVPRLGVPNIGSSEGIHGVVPVSYTHLNGLLRLLRLGQSRGHSRQPKHL